MADTTGTEKNDFILEAIQKDLDCGRYKYVRTRFAPEPNAYLHIGSAISMSATYDAAETLGWEYNLRIDDTNPATEREEYVRAIEEDIRWLGYDWHDREYYASEYFEQLYSWAVDLIKGDKAYVCDLSEDEIKTYRGTNTFRGDGKRQTPPGTDSPFRGRSIEENLDLFQRMRNGEFPDGARTLRAKIDMRHDNLIMRDPVMYRIMHANHFRIGDSWCIYPTYDWAHGQSDSIEGITHSLCTLEFENHRPLYDWYIENLPVPHRPRQIEVAPLALTYTVLSKRYLRRLVEEDLVGGWDDPRMPTIRGMMRRGYTRDAIQTFIRGVGVTKADSVVDIAFLEYCLRQELNKSSPRVMAVLDPLKIVLTNYPKGRAEELEAVNNPEDPSAGTRSVPFSRELYIEREDFMEDPPKKFFRLAPGREVRLRYAYFVRCDEIVKDADGKIVELRCTYDPATRGGNAPDGRKVKATLHWVSAEHAIDAEVRLYDHLFSKENPNDVGEGETWLDNLNGRSLEVLSNCKLERCLASAAPGERFQFERKGYFCVDPDTTSGRPVFNRTVTLRDTWARLNMSALA